MNTLTLSIFKNHSDADAAADNLLRRGINSQDVSIVTKEETYNTTNGSAVAGATTGGIIGGITGLLVGVGAIIIPGIGSVFVGGPLVAAFGLTGVAAIATATVSGGITGAITGGLIGGLIGLGMSEKDAQLYETHVKEGAIILAVTTEAEKTPVVNEILNSNHAAEIKTLNVKEPSTNP